MEPEEAQEIINQAERSMVDASLAAMPQIPVDVKLEMQMLDDRMVLWKIAEAMVTSAIYEKYKRNQTEVDVKATAACIVHALEQLGFHR